MHEIFVPMCKVGVGDANLTIHDTSGAISHANHFKVNGMKADMSGILVLSGWVNGLSPYLGSMSLTTSTFAEAVTATSTSGIQGITFGNGLAAEVTLPPGYAVSSCSIWCGDTADSWGLTYGRLKSIAGISLNQSKPTGHTI